MITPPTGAIVVLGTDLDGRPRAARFAMTDEAAVRRAARAMGYQAVVVVNPAGLTMAARLKPGRLYRTRSSFAAVVSQKLYDDLADLATVDGETANGDVTTDQPVQLVQMLTRSRSPTFTRGD